MLLISILVWQTGFGVEFRDGGPNDYYDAASSRRFQRVLNSVEKLHLHKAIAHLQQGQISAACLEIEFTLRWYPNHPRGLQFVAELYDKHACPNSKTAEEHFTTAQNFRPNDPIAYILYGLYLHKKGFLEKAAKQYNLALPLAPESSDLHYNLGLLYIETKDYDKALHHAKKAYDIGHPLPGLRKKLKNLGLWPDTAKKN